MLTTTITSALLIAVIKETVVTIFKIVIIAAIIITLPNFVVLEKGCSD